MILKGSQRGFGQILAAHLMNTRDNDHVALHELRGFYADDLKGAFRETEAISRGTRCSQYLFSLSLSPPENEHVPIAVFEQAIDRIEDRLGLQGQSRVVVFHDKEGRRQPPYRVEGYRRGRSGFAAPLVTAGDNADQLAVAQTM